MKILIVTPYISFIYGGTARVVKDIAQALGQQGLQVDVVTTTANGSSTLDVPCFEWSLEFEYRIQYFPCWHKYDFVASQPLLWWLSKHIHEYDVVHTHTLFSPMLALIHKLCLRRDVPYVMTPHGMLESWALGNKPRKKSIYFRLIESDALNKAHAIQVLTKHEQNILLSKGFKNTILVSNGIHIEPFIKLTNANLFQQTFPETQNKTLILFMGRLDPKKGLDLLASAFAKARSQFPNIHLVVAGPDSIGYLPKVAQYFINQKCLDAVTFTGMLSGEIKYSALTAASIFVLPSYSEGFSMSILEGMASGLPCIFTKECNFPEALEAGTAYVVSANPEQLTQAIIHCLSHPDRAQEMGGAARNFIFSNYTWTQSANRLIQFYKVLSPQELSSLTL